MWSGNTALIVINAFIILVHSLPSNIDQSTLRNNLDPVDQNERILKLFLQLAAHTANRLTHLRKETKRYDCNRRNDNPVSTTEVLVTQSSPQANLEWLDESRQILTRSFLGDLEINSNQTVLHSQLQHQSPEFDLSDRQNINDRNVARDSKMSNLITKSVKGIQETSSDVTGHNREALNSLEKSIRNLDTARNSQNASEFGLDSPKSTRNITDLQNQIDLAKDITNTMDDLTGTVNKFFPHSQDLQGSTFGISQRLFGADLAQNVPKVINDVYANRHIPQNTRESSDRSDDVSQTFFDVINNSGNVLTPSTANNLSAMNQTLSSTKNIVESMTKVLPEVAKNASNLLNQIIPKSHDIINSSLKIAEESQKYLVHSGYIQQELSKNTKPTENQSDNQFHSQQDLTSNSGDNNAASERDNQETKANSSLPINQNNLEGEDNNQLPATSSNDSSILSVRFFSDFNGEETNNTTESDLFSVQPNKDLNNFTEENLSQTISYNETDQRLDQTDRQIKVGEFKKLNETGYGDDQLNPILEESSQRSTESGSTDVAVATSASPDQTESSTFALVSITERPANGSSDAQDFRNASDVTKVNAEETGRPQDKSSTNDEINRPTKSEITHCDDKVLESNGSLIGELTSEDSSVQLSEAKLQKISDRLINALRSYLEKKTDNRRYATDQWDNNLRSNISSDSKQINEQDSNLKNQDQIEDATLHLQKENYNRRKEAINKRR